MTAFANKAKERMAELNMSQKTLAEKCGIPASSLNRYLTTTEPRIDIVINVSKALGVEPNYFYETIKPSMDPYNEALSVVGRTKNALTPEEKAKIVEMLFSK